MANHRLFLYIFLVGAVVGFGLLCVVIYSGYGDIGGMECKSTDNSGLHRPLKSMNDHVELSIRTNRTSVVTGRDVKVTVSVRNRRNNITLDITIFYTLPPGTGVGASGSGHYSRNFEVPPGDSKTHSFTVQFNEQGGYLINTTLDYHFENNLSRGGEERTGIVVYRCLPDPERRMWTAITSPNPIFSSKVPWFGKAFLLCSYLIFFTMVFKSLGKKPSDYLSLRPPPAEEGTDPRWSFVVLVVDTGGSFGVGMGATALVVPTFGLQTLSVPSVLFPVLFLDLILLMHRFDRWFG